MQCNVMFWTQADQGISRPMDTDKLPLQLDTYKRITYNFVCYSAYNQPTQPTRPIGHQYGAMLVCMYVCVCVCVCVSSAQIWKLNIAQGGTGIEHWTNWFNKEGNKTEYILFTSTIHYSVTALVAATHILSVCLCALHLQFANWKQTVQLYCVIGM